MAIYLFQASVKDVYALTTDLTGNNIPRPPNVTWSLREGYGELDFAFGDPEAVYSELAKTGFLVFEAELIPYPVGQPTSPIKHPGCG